MTLEEIKNNYKKKSWLRLCTLHSINKWELINSEQEPVFSGKYFINKVPPIQTQCCLLCNTLFDLGIYKNSFIAIKQCTCGIDGTNNSTVQKLLPFYSEDISKLIFASICNSRKKGLPNTVEYWIHKGYSLEQSIQKVSDKQKERSSKSAAAQPGAKGYTNRFIDYWIKKGYSAVDAKIKLKESQTKNGLAYYIKRFGTVEGPIKYNARIQKWLSSPNNVKMTLGRSKKSIELFEKLGVGYYGSSEKTIRGTYKVHRVDFLFGKQVIEFFGDYWHGNPTKYPPGTMIRKKRIEDVWEHDAKKILDLKKAGYNVMVIWEDDYCKDPASVLKLCKKFIYENYSTDC